MKGELRMERMNHYSTIRKNPVKRYLEVTIKLSMKLRGVKNI